MDIYHRSLYIDIYIYAFLFISCVFFVLFLVFYSVAKRRCEELLRGAESKEAAEAALKKALESRDVSTLKFALQQVRKTLKDSLKIY